MSVFFIIDSILNILLLFLVSYLLTITTAGDDDSIRRLGQHMTTTAANDGLSDGPLADDAIHNIVWA